MVLRLLSKMPMTTNPELDATRGALGAGVYGLAELRAFLAFSGSPEDAERALPWLTSVLNPAGHRRRQADYSFSDLISLFVVRELLKKGVPQRTIHDAEKWLRAKWGTDRPFVRDEIKTDGVDVFCDDEVIPQQIESANRQGQQTLREAIKDRLTSVRYSDGVAACWVPASGVVIDPRVQFGEPVVKGTRIPTEAVANVAQNLGADRATVRFGLTHDQIVAAVAFENQIASLN